MKSNLAYRYEKETYIYRETYKNNYTPSLPNEIRDNKSINDRAKFMLHTLLSYPKDWNLNINKLSKDCSMSIKTAYKYLNILIEESYVYKYVNVDKKRKIVKWVTKVFSDKEKCKKFKQQIEFQEMIKEQSTSINNSSKGIGLRNKYKFIKHDNKLPICTTSPVGKNYQNTNNINIYIKNNYTASGTRKNEENKMDDFKSNKNLMDNNKTGNRNDGGKAKVKEEMNHKRNYESRNNDNVVEFSHKPIPTYHSNKKHYYEYSRRFNNNVIRNRAYHDEIEIDKFKEMKEKEQKEKLENRRLKILQESTNVRKSIMEEERKIKDGFYLSKKELKKRCDEILDQLKNKNDKLIFEQ